MNWTKLDLVAKIEFADWTGAGLVRQAAFKGLREDKPAAEVEAEKPAPPEATAVLPKPTSRLKAALRVSNPLGKGGNPVVMGVLISNPDNALWPDAHDGEPILRLRFRRTIGLPPTSIRRVFMTLPIIRSAMSPIL